MALNIATFKTRLFTAIIFTAVMITGLLWNQWSFFVLFSVIHFGCWFEYQKIIGKIDPEYRQISSFHKTGVMIAGWCILLYFTSDLFNIGDFSIHAVGWWLGLIFVFILPIIELLFAKNLSLKNIGYSFAGLLYISLSWGLFVDLYQLRYTNPNLAEHMPNIPLVIVLGMWINDTMAYLVGSFIGKTPFSKISPKKTWEGTLGGLILCIGVVGLVANSQISNILGVPKTSPVPGYHWFIIAGIIGIFGTAGDLLESKLKRMADIKDSGQIMPGHGGFLDRFDSLLIAIPFVWIYIRCFL